MMLIDGDTTNQPIKREGERGTVTCRIQSWTGCTCMRPKSHPLSPSHHDFLPARIHSGDCQSKRPRIHSGDCQSKRRKFSRH
eukprot:COSAG04_NODE_2916_length_3388_cov_1.855275_3_plen_82_part_00